MDRWPAQQMASCISIEIVFGINRRMYEHWTYHYWSTIKTTTQQSFRAFFACILHHLTGLAKSHNRKNNRVHPHETLYSMESHERGGDKRDRGGDIELRYVLGFTVPILSRGESFLP